MRKEGGKERQKEEKQGGSGEIEKNEDRKEGRKMEETRKGRKERN